MEYFEKIELRDSRLEPVRRALIGGQRFGKEMALACLETPDVFGLAALAHAKKREHHGDHVTYVLNRQLNPTNVCYLDCSFCDFAAKPRDAHAYELGREDWIAAVEGDVREVHIVGGLHPKWKFDDYLRIVREVRRARPDIQIKAFTAVEVDYFARRSRLSVREVLCALIDAGVETLPGGGAEVFSERVRGLLFPKKIGADRWLEIHSIAHDLGMPTGATMLYGHVETREERVDHMLRLRAAQDESGGFRAFIPLAYQAGSPQGRQRNHPLLPAFTTSAIDDLRTLATSRLVIDNVPHIKAYWVMLGLASAACALNAGASDMDGTVGVERIAHAAGARTPESLACERLENMAREAGAIPVERDATYQLVKRLPPNSVGAGGYA